MNVSKTTRYWVGNRKLKRGTKCLFCISFVSLLVILMLAIHGQILSFLLENKFATLSTFLKVKARVYSADSGFSARKAIIQ